MSPKVAKASIVVVAVAACFSLNLCQCICRFNDNFVAKWHMSIHRYELAYVAKSPFRHIASRITHSPSTISLLIVTFRTRRIVLKMSQVFCNLPKCFRLDISGYSQILLITFFERECLSLGVAIRS
jgi:hypothetical protein